MLNFGEFKNLIRRDIWPTGEAGSLVTAHDKMFVDALVDIQIWADCYQNSNTQLYPQCSTFYNCGMTVFDAPRGRILRVTTIDKINPDTGKEDPESDDDWCKEIEYRPVEIARVREYLGRSVASGNCLNLPLFFGLPLGLCRKGSPPVPTGEEVTNLGPLPLGFHYAETSTDAAARSQCGLWAMDRGKIYLVPWLQSTETVVVYWDGLKRVWTESDPVDNDPMLARAVKLYLQKEHARDFDRNPNEAQQYEREYNMALATLVHECRQESTQRSSELAYAAGAGGGTGRGSSTDFTSGGGGAMYFNSAQSGHAECPDNQTGTPVTITVMAGTVGSPVSVGEANRLAKAQAEALAKAALVCNDSTEIFYNEQVSAVATCSTDADHEVEMIGGPIVVTVQARTVEFNSNQSVEDANNKAIAWAQAEAERRKSGKCKWWNKEVEYNDSCIFVGPPPPLPHDATVVIAAHTFSSVISKEDADELALAEAKRQVWGIIGCGGGGGGGIGYGNQVRTGSVRVICPVAPYTTYRANWTYAANLWFAATQSEANRLADLFVSRLLQSQLTQWGIAGNPCGPHSPFVGNALPVITYTLFTG